MRFRSELDPLRPYIPPKSWRMAAEGTDEQRYAKLTSNELAFGPLPEAEAALAEVLPRANRYPDSHVSRLREVGAEANPGTATPAAPPPARPAPPHPHPARPGPRLGEGVAEANPGTETSNVLVGNGSSEVLLNALQLLPAGGEVVYPWPSFSLYPMLCAVLGMAARPVPLTETDGVPAGIPAEDVLSAVTDRTRAVILCNPNNPSGAFLTLEEVRAFAQALPKHVLLIVDEAYVEFVDDPACGDSYTLALEAENVVVARTFSKAHGLAGLRGGYGIAPARTSDYAERVRRPGPVHRAAQVAATASML